ncbi:MAG: hypothetical protein KAJ51_06540 [Thermoplasmata archaeon]|nr:hypothetical protein [Thermoplasmata archaeon]
MKTKTTLTAILTIAIVLLMVLSVIPSVASDDGGRGGGGGGRVNKVLFWDDTYSTIPSPGPAPSGYKDYQAAIEAYGAKFTRITKMPTLSQMQQYDVVFYYIGSEYTGMVYPSKAEWQLMEKYLSGGGQMVWVGNHVAVGAVKYGFDTFQIEYFGTKYSGYMHDLTKSKHYVYGTNGNIGIPSSSRYWLNPMHPEIGGRFYTTHDVLQPTKPGVYEMCCLGLMPVIEATMISMDTNKFKTVCWSFDLNHIDSSKDQAKLMALVLDFFEGGIPADVRFFPQALNLDSKGKFVQVKVEGFPDNPEYTPMDVDGTSVAVSGVGVDLKYGTWNNNRFIGKTDRLLVEDSIGAPGNEVEVDVSGKLNDGTGFKGEAIIKAL